MIVVTSARRTPGAANLALRSGLMVASLVLLGACGGSADQGAMASDSAAQAPSQEEGPNPAATASGDRLERAAENIVGYLVNDSDFDQIALADTVLLQVSAEGGGGSVRRTRGQLQDLSSWSVQSNGITYSFVPTGRFPKMIAKAGSHFNCMETTLASRAPGLGALPHVGVRLQREEATCLETWNATFVFDTTGGRPRLIAALYDQWEW